MPGSGLVLALINGPWPLSRFVPRPSFLMGVVGQSEPSVRWEGPNCKMLDVVYFIGNTNFVQ